MYLIELKLFSFSFFLFFFLLIEQNFNFKISGIRKCQVVKRNLHRKAQRQPSNSKNLRV